MNKKAGHSVSETGRPNSMVELRNTFLKRKRKIKQLRFYGYDGRVYKDIDFEHPDNGTHEFPHTHRWYWNSDGSSSRTGELPYK